MLNFKLNEEKTTTSSKATLIRLAEKNSSGVTIQIPAEVFVTLLSSLQRVPRLRTSDADLIVVKQRFDMTFHQFAKLPKELRDMIWAAAANSSETIRICTNFELFRKEPDTAGWHITPFATNNPRYNLLQACRDARNVVANIHTLVFRNWKQGSSESVIENDWLAMNVDVDMLWLTGFEENYVVAYEYAPWAKEQETRERT